MIRGAQPFFTPATHGGDGAGRQNLFPTPTATWGKEKPRRFGGVSKTENAMWNQFRDLRSPPMSTPRSWTGAGVSVASLPEARIRAVEVASVEAALAG